MSAGKATGSWEPTEITSDHVKFVRPYLKNNLPNLFPEFVSGGWDIACAKIQIVSGYNLLLDIKSEATAFLVQIHLHVDVTKKISFRSFAKPDDAPAVPNGYEWHDPAEFKDLTHAEGLIREKGNIQIEPSGKVLVYRTIFENDLDKTHIIFRDGMASLFSAVYAKNPKNHEEQLVSVHAIN